MPQKTLVEWQMKDFRTITRCLVIETDAGYRVHLESGNREWLDELHLSCEAALLRAQELRARLRGRRLYFRRPIEL